ncbi:MAG: ATP-binding protein [Rhodocyclaceae bacterium]|nr:ATP-binding protein [Rhodocyclaceae bacterium]
MDAFVWSSQFMTGEPIVDAEHQELVRIINQVGNLHVNDGDGATVGQLLARVIRYATDHFDHEEALMARIGCDLRHADWHRGIHQDFAKQISAMHAADNGLIDAEFLLRFLTNWLAYHILGVDQVMARQLRNIRTGMSPQQAYEREQREGSDPATASLLNALSALYRIVAGRNEALMALNRNLDQEVEARTRELFAANSQLKVEHDKLKVALSTVEAAQQQLVASERQRAGVEAQRALQQLLAQIIDGDPVPTLVIDAQHRVTHWNKACATVTNVSAAEMIGTTRQWAPFYKLERPIMADLIVDRVLEDKVDAYYKGKFRPSPLIAGAFEAEDYFPHLGASGRWFNFTAAPLRDEKGGIIGAIETLQDVTERHKAEDDLRQYQAHLEDLVEKRTVQLGEAREQLLQAEKLASIGQLAAGVAHEINNPIGFIHSNIGTLEKYSADLLGMLSAYEAAAKALPAEHAAQLAAQHRAIDVNFLREDLPSLIRESKEGIDRVRKIVQDLKDFSRVDSSQDWQWANLHRGLDSTLGIVNNEIKYKADVVKEYGDLPDVECLPSQLNQVFMNLLVNAAHAIGDKRGRITIRSGLAGDMVWFEFADTGCGIPEDIRQKIFDPFFTTKPVGQGTGLGLSLSYGIVRTHNGRIEVDSQVGRGSTFRVTLPIRQSREAASDKP